MAMTIGLLTVLAVASHLCEVYLSGWIIYKVSISMSRVWKVFANVKGYFAFLTQKGAMPQVLGLLRAWLYSICRFVQPRPDGCLSRIKRQSNTAYSIVQPWLDDRVSLICLYKLPDSWRRRQVGEHIRKCINSYTISTFTLLTRQKNTNLSVR